MDIISFGRAVTSQLDTALQREWLVTNGIGGYASSTIALANTRRYHGLLVAALQSPRGRTLLVSKLEATARLGADLYPLSTNEYIDGTINPHGYLNLERFRLEGMIPVFTWAVADNLIEQRVWMVHGQNTTYVTYSLVRASHPIALEIIPLCTYRESGSTSDIRGWHPDVRAVTNGLHIDAYPNAVPYYVWTNQGTLVPGVVRHWSLRHRAESYRGLDEREDLFAVGRLDAKLSEGETLALVLTIDGEAQIDWRPALEAEKTRQAELLTLAKLQNEPSWIQRLVFAADQFVVDRSSSGKATALETANTQSKGKTLLTSYPWCGNAARDLLMALPGLALITGRSEIAASILRAAARSTDRGVLPNRFLDSTGPVESPTHGTADAALWLFSALQYYLAWTNDYELLEELYSAMTEIIKWHQKGTPYGLGVDEDDGLLTLGEPALNLALMGDQDNGWIIQHRIGKTIEINALWHNALSAMAQFSETLDQPGESTVWREMAAEMAERFEARFWYTAGGYLYDVIDGINGDDATLRPNQILAVSLPHSPLKDQNKARAVVDTVGRHLQTSYGLRTLPPRHSAYVPRYGGNPAARANALHNGTVWGWLIGPFVAAHYKVYGNRDKARSYLIPFADQLNDHGVGTISQLFDGNSPHKPRSCIASALSVAQVLCGWFTCAN